MGSRSRSRYVTLTAARGSRVGAGMERGGEEKRKKEAIFQCTQMHLGAKRLLVRTVEPSCIRFGG